MNVWRLRRPTGKPLPDVVELEDRFGGLTRYERGRHGMNNVTLRIIFAGAFALLALMGAVLLEGLNHDSGGAPEWLTAIAALSAGYALGHAQVNGLTGKHE